MSVTSEVARGIAVGPSARPGFVSKPALLRAALLLGCIASVALAASLGRPEHLLASDLELARLLRGMAIIKSAIVLAGIALLLWRFGRPLSARMAGVYLAGAWLSAGASMLVWQLTLIPLAAGLFHMGELSLLMAAWRDSRDPARRVSGR